MLQLMKQLAPALWKNSKIHLHKLYFYFSFEIDIVFIEQEAFVQSETYLTHQPS